MPGPAASIVIDDALEPGAAGAAVRELGRRPYAKLHWPLREIDRDGRALGTLNPEAPLDEGELVDRVLERVMPLSEDLRVCADAYLYDLAPLFGRIARAREPLGRLRRHASAFGGLGLEDRLEPDEDRWRARSWPLRQRRALDALWTVVPRGVPFALADAGTFAMEPPVVPVAPDASAGDVAATGARVLAVPWPGFAWLARVRPALRARRVLLQSDDLVVLELA